jgi:hypothetical protein
VDGNFLRYNAQNGWYASAIDYSMVGAMPSILTSYYYGTELPSDPVEGRLFFVKDSNE